MLRRPRLFNRFPILRWREKEDEQIVPHDEQEKYPTLAKDFQYLARELLPHFQELDNEALRAQNQFRLQQVILIFGSMLAAVVGAIQATFPAFRMLGVVGAALAAGVGAVAWRARALNAQRRYSTMRLKAETLRGEYFLFLGRIGPYGNDSGRLQHLIQRVADIKKEEK
jgi:hypothetical protein